MKIKELTLFTTNIAAQRQFYADVLELPVLVDTDIEISFKIGASALTFHYAKSIKPSHFAFNIPANKAQEALAWLQERVTILPCEGKPIADFRNWNAEAIYFYDADQNIVECIARKNLNTATEEVFSVKQLLNISEMAIVSTDNQAVFQDIQQQETIPIYDGSFERFCAIGDEEGLFILVNKDLKKWYPTLEDAYVSDFKISGTYSFSYTNGKIIPDKSHENY